MVHYNMLSEIQENERLKAWRFKVKLIRIYSFEVFGDGPFWSYILADTAGNKTEMIIPPSEAYRFEGLEKGEGNWVEILCVQVQDAFTGFRPINCPFRLAVIEGTHIYPIPHQNNHHYMEFKSIHVIKHATNVEVPIDTMGVVFNVEPLEVCSDPKMINIVFHIRYNIENQIRCVATGKAASAFQYEYELNKGLGVVIVVLKMWRICKHDRGDAEPWLKTHKGLSDLRINPQMKEVDDFRRELANSDPYVAKYGPIVPMQHLGFYYALFSSLSLT